VFTAGSPFYHSVVDGRSASASGAGLDRIITHRSTSFNVLTSTVGADAYLDVTVQGKQYTRYIVAVTRRHAGGIRCQSVMKF